MTDVNKNSIQQKLDNLRSFLQRRNIKNKFREDTEHYIFSKGWLFIEASVFLVMIGVILPIFGPDKMSIFYLGEHYGFFISLGMSVAVALGTAIVMSGALWLVACLIDYLVNTFQSLDNRLSTVERSELSNLTNDLNDALKGCNTPVILPKIDTTLSLNDLSANVEQVQQLVNQGKLTEPVTLSSVASAITSAHTVAVPSSTDVTTPLLNIDSKSASLN